MKRNFIAALVFIAVVVALAFALLNNKEEQKQAGIVDPKTEDIEKPEIATKAYEANENTGKDLRLGTIQEDNAAYTRYFITYKSGELTISGIMNIPKGEGPFTVLVLNHGYIDTGIYTNGRGLRREQDYFARNGFAVIHPDYRNHAQSDKDPDIDVHLRYGYVEDVINAVYAIKNSDLAMLDKGRIGMLGHSMGGGIAQAVMVAQPKLVDAVSLYAPVSGDQYKNFERYTSRRPEISTIILEKYGTPETNPKFWEEASPITYFDRVEIPVIYHHGTNDADVPYAWSEESVGILRAEGKDVEFYTYEREGHEFSFGWNLFMQRNVEFFRENLKN